MFKRYAIGTLAASATALFTLAGCAGSQPAGSQSISGRDAATARGDVSSATEFAAAASRGQDLDYDKLATPATAVAASTLIVRGTLVDVTDGITFGGAGAAQSGRGSSYGTVVIEVATTAKGHAAPGSKVHAVFNKSAITGAADLAKAGKNLKVVVALSDISTWSPAPGVTVLRPAGMPAKGPLYLAFPDGLWLQGSADKTMVGVHAKPADIPTAWGAPQTLDQYWTTLQKAAK
jgi:hypothetical protein